MDPLNMMLIGCGMMGRRHLLGYAELERVQKGSLCLCAVVDPRLEEAKKIANEAEQLFGHHPLIYRTIGEALRNEVQAEVADVVTPPQTHHTVAVPLLEAGINVIVEKPIAVTIELAESIIDAARRYDRILTVAENNRYDPMNRLMKHIIQSGLIGKPYFVIQTSMSKGRHVVGSPWRHSIATGGLILDVGIHQGYILEMLLGPIKSIYANSNRVWSKRLLKHEDGELEEIPVEADDTFSAILTFESGARGVWVMHFGSQGVNQWQRTIFGDSGTVEGPVDRSGKPIRIQKENEVFEGDVIVGMLHDFKLNEIESRLFGEHPGSYLFADQIIDRKLIAAEMADFVHAVNNRQMPEVPGELGLRSIAISYAVIESSESGGLVELKDIISGKVCHFQKRVEKASL